MSRRPVGPALALVAGTLGAIVLSLGAVVAVIAWVGTTP